MSLDFGLIAHLQLRKEDGKAKRMIGSHYSQYFQESIWEPPNVHSIAFYRGDYICLYNFRALSCWVGVCWEVMC